jgi:Alcohol dehydrogenase GroES-like domain
MKQMFIVGHGGPEKLQPREFPDPSPGGGEIRIRVKASGINFADILARQGLYPDSPKIPCVVGYEVSGTVDTVGPGVDQSWVGRDVLAPTRFGGYSDVVVVREKQVFAKPASLSHEHAAAIPVNYVTAWQLLVVMGSLKREETVLVHNVGGGVGPCRDRYRAPHRRHDLRNGKRRQARLPDAARPARGHRLPHERLGGRTGSAHPWKRGGAHHRSARRQSLEEELQGAAFDGTARDVWYFGGNDVEAVRAAASAAGCARYAVLPSARADDHKQISLRREPRTHVA